MRRVRVSSSALASVGYDPTNETLEVEFTGGRLYRYYAVPAAVHEVLMAAESKGGFYSREIRDRYPYARLDR